jgi:hydroxyethylthiazole kinase-like uncharacterized protein yjeF
MTAALRVTPDLLRDWPLPDPMRTEGKQDRGQVLVIGGSIKVPGGVMLAAVASLRAGAGKLQIAAPEEAATAIAVAIPEAKVLPIPTGPDGEMYACTSELAEAASEANAILLGPGVTAHRGMHALAADVAAAAQGILALDAGAIEASRHLEAARPMILTPNVVEAARLGGYEADQVKANALSTAKELAARHGAVVALKDATTCIAHPDGRCWLHEGGGPGLGTSGSGDVLAGLIAGLCARGAKPEQAAVVGVWLHAQAGARLAKRLGTVGFLARELGAEVPALMQQLHAAARVSTRAATPT